MLNVLPSLKSSAGRVGQDGLVQKGSYVDDVVEDAVWKLSNGEITPPIKTKDASFFNRFGQLIYQEPLGRAAGYDHPQFSIHRGDPQMVLLEAFMSRVGPDRILTNHQCVRVEQE